MNTAEIFSVFFSVIEAVLVFVGLLIAAYNIHQAKLSFDENVKQSAAANSWNKKISAQNALEKIDNSVVLSRLQEKFDYVNRKGKIPLAQVQSAFEKDPSLQVDLYSLLNTYEKIARGVNLGIFDNDVVRLGRRRSMAKAFLAFEEVISDRRENYGAATAWAELEKLLTDWENAAPLADTKIEFSNDG